MRTMIKLLCAVVMCGCSAAPDVQEEPSGEVKQALHHLILTPQGPTDVLPHDAIASLFSQGCVGTICTANPPDWAPYIRWNLPDVATDKLTSIRSAAQTGNYFIWTWGNFFVGDQRCFFRNSDTQYITSVEAVWVSVRVSTGSHVEPFSIFMTDPAGRSDFPVTQTFAANLTNAEFEIPITTRVGGGALRPVDLGCGAVSPPKLGYYVIGYGINVKSFKVTAVQYTVTP